MRFLVDENLPLALSRWLSEAGFHAEHTSAIGLNATADLDIAMQAIRTDTVIVTKDSDYLTLARGRPGLRVVHVRSGNLTSGQLLALCGRVWPGVVDALETGEPVVQIGSVR